MRVKSVFLTIVISVFMLNKSLFASIFPDASITIKVINELGVPMDNIDVGATFREGAKFHTIEGKTDNEGLFKASSSSDDEIAYGANKNGYYESLGKFQFQKIDNGKWLPWNPEVTLVLRKIENPVAMYARDTQMSRMEIPVAGKDVGFDLIEYDWVEPYGKGKHADFIFKLDRKFVSEDDFESTLTLTFPNRFDGIQLFRENRRYGSKFKLPRFASETGYQTKIVRTKRRAPGKAIEEDYEQSNNYIFRVRSEEKDGKLIRALYGKIQGDVRFDPRGTNTAVILFTYYLNPDYTKNLEFDPKQNLFKNLKSTEEVGLE